MARMKLLSLGPDWSRSYQEKADRRPQPNPSSSPYNAETQIHRNDGVTMAILGLIALPSLMGYVWIQRGETWKAVLLGLGLVAHQEGPRRGQAPRPAAHQGEGLPHRLRGRARGHRRPVAARDREPGQGAAAQRGLGLPGLRQPRRGQLQGGEGRPAVPATEPWPPRRGMWQSRNVLGVREASSLWHPLGAGDDLPMVARSGARVLFPSAKGVAGGAHVGDTVSSRPRKIHFQDDTLRRHHLYVARTRMGKSTLMHHIVTHKRREKAAGEGGGQGRRRHRGHRPPPRPGGRPVAARAR